MKKLLFVLMTLCMVSLVSSMLLPQKFNVRKPDMRAGEILFSPANDAELACCEQFAYENNATIHKVTRVLPIYLLRFESVVSKTTLSQLAKTDVDAYWHEFEKCRVQVLAMCEKLSSTGAVNFAQPNLLYYITYTPDDPYFTDDGDYLMESAPDQYGYFITRCERAWDFSRGNRNTKLCIIDSGSDIDHPDLLANVWVNQGEDIDGDGEPYDLDDVNYIDDDGNGYVDDLNGYDFVGGNVGDDTDDITEEDFNPDVHYFGDDGWGEPDPSVGDGIASSMWMPADAGVAHGTHCAGISAAVMDNGSDFAGGCGGAVSLIAVRVMTPEGTGNSADMVAGVEYAAIIGADVASMSFGGGFGSSDPALETACNFAYAGDVALIAASGNEGGMFGVSSPASMSICLAVGSFTSSLARSDFSNYGPELDVLASGGESSLWTGEVSEVVWSTWVRSVAEADSIGTVDPGTHAIAGMVGTSMACPHAAGLAALIRSINPTLSNEEVYDIMRSTAHDIGTPGFDEETGFGIVDFGAACSVATAGITECKPTAHAIANVFPNPANPTAEITVDVPKTGNLHVEIFDVQGKSVARLFDGVANAGTLKLRVPENLPSGTYTAKISGVSANTNLKLTILK